MTRIIVFRADSNAGAFVHFKQFSRPDHPGRPAASAGSQVFPLAGTGSVSPTSYELDVDALCAACGRLATEIAAGGFTHNPWHPSRSLQLDLIRA
jgi:hypothetical protein